MSIMLFIWEDTKYLPHALSILFTVNDRLLHQASIIHQDQHTRCNSVSNKTQQFYVILLHSFHLLDATSDAAVALTTLTTTAAVVWVGFSNINIAPGVSPLLHSLISSANLYLPHSSSTQEGHSFCYMQKLTLQLYICRKPRLNVAGTSDCGV